MQKKYLFVLTLILGLLILYFMLIRDEKHDDQLLDLMQDDEQTMQFQSPTEGEVITFPFEIKGVAKGPWFFEGSFPLRILDDRGKVIAESYVDAQGNWMTEDDVEFATTITDLDWGDAEVGTIIAMRNNPSGLPENDEQKVHFFQFPDRNDYEAISFYWVDRSSTIEGGCGDLVEGQRLYKKDEVSLERVVSDLVNGLSNQERVLGYDTLIPDATEFQINNSNQVMINAPGMSGVCYEELANSQFEKTIEKISEGIEVLWSTTSS